MGVAAVFSCLPLCTITLRTPSTVRLIAPLFRPSVSRYRGGKNKAKVMYVNTFVECSLVAQIYHMLLIF